MGEGYLIPQCEYCQYWNDDTHWDFGCTRAPFSACSHLGKKTYIYDGPVMIFGNCVARRWFGQTSAVSERKAVSNFMFQWKRKNGLAVNSKIELPGRIYTVD